MYSMKHQQQGFTLIEIMVVVVIAAILMGAVTLSFPRTGDDLLKEEATRFSALVSLLEDEAILQSRDMAIAINDAGYAFYQNKGEVWEKYADRPFVARHLEAGIPSELYIEGIPVQLEKIDKTKPQIVAYTSGEVTPFLYILGDLNHSHFKIEVNPAGNVKQTYQSDNE